MACILVEMVNKKENFYKVLFLSFLDNLKSKCYFIIKWTIAPLMGDGLTVMLLGVLFVVSNFIAIGGAGWL